MSALLRWWDRHAPTIFVHCGCCLDHRRLHNIRLNRRGSRGLTVAATCKDCTAHMPDQCQLRKQAIRVLAGLTPFDPEVER